MSASHGKSAGRHHLRWARGLTCAAALLALVGCTAPASSEAHAADVLGRLVQARGVSGREGPVREVVLAELARINPDWKPQTDEAGNLRLALGSGSPSRLVIAHMDEIGLAVTKIRDDGLLESKRVGGFHDHLYHATAIELVTAHGDVLPGIALPLPAAASEATQAPAAAPSATPADATAAAPAQGAPAKLPPVLLDVGARNAAEAAALGVVVGDTATVPKELLRLGAHRVAGRSNDDRVGCAALLLALESLAHTANGGANLPHAVTFVFSTREEVGLEGADALARTLRPVPDIVFAVDTFVTSDSPREDPHYAFARLGDGPVLRALDNSSVTPPWALVHVREIAERDGIELQTGTMGGSNDGSTFVPEGSTDCPLAWPQRNSHSRVETADLRDVVQLGALIAAVATAD